MSGCSRLTRRRFRRDPTHALFADQSHSFPDNVMALFGRIRAWNYSAETARSAVGGSPSSLKASLSKSNSCRPAGASRIARYLLRFAGGGPFIEDDLPRR